MKHFTTISLVMAAMLAAPAYAQSISSASLSNFNVQLIDLDLNDGIAPSITPYSSNSDVNSYAGKTATPQFAHDYDTNNFRAMSASIASDVSQGNASISGAGFSTAAFNASGYATGLDNQYNGNSYAYIYFTLSANTQAIFTADASIFGNVTDPVGEYAIASASLMAASVIRNDITPNSDYIYFAAYCNVTNCVDSSFSQSRTLSATITNPFAEAINAYSLGLSNAYGISNAIPSSVPVPAALPLMASALGLFGVAKRRKQNKA